ncbi:MAG TPA: hypothetical protein VK817_08535 [Trebonia sp.]|jgi:hypothetical protein|nr:hypothetical protein [Trebonia sp.]
MTASQSSWSSAQTAAIAADISSGSSSSESSTSSPRVPKARSSSSAHSMARANSLSSSDMGSPCGDATEVARVSHISVSSGGKVSAFRPLNDTSICPGQPGRAMSDRSLAAAVSRSAFGSGRSPTCESRARSAFSASASAAAQSARNASSCSSSSTFIGTRPSGSGVVIHCSWIATYSRLACASPAASWSGSMSPAVRRSSR